MKCNNCKAEWVPPAGIITTACPFCAVQLMSQTNTSNASPVEVIISTVIKDLGVHVLLDKEKLVRIITGIQEFDSKTKKMLILAIRTNVCEDLYDLAINKNTQTDIKSIVTYFAVGNSLSLSDAQMTVDVFESACSAAMNAEKKDEPKVTSPEKEMISEPYTPEQPDKQEIPDVVKVNQDIRREVKQQEKQTSATQHESPPSNRLNNQPATATDHQKLFSSVTVKPGECVTFGHYEQNMAGRKDPITWRVLTVKNDRALLLSNEILDCKPYSRVLKDAAWETCTLRAWLNNGFYNEAFCADEKSIIQATCLNYDENPGYIETGDDDSLDKVFLLSYNESINPGYGFSPDKSKYDPARWAQGTEYAKKNGLWTSENSEIFRNAYWWLRPSKTMQHKIGVVYFYGAVNILPDNAQNKTNIGVRPAIWISIAETEQKPEKQQAHIADDTAVVHKPTSVGKSAKTTVEAKLKKQTKQEQPEQKNPSMNLLKTGDIIHFGQYEQNKAGSKDPIAWRVLTAEKGKALLLSEMILDSKPYNTVKKDVTWETCTLRAWLNNEFFNAAFNTNEKLRIQTTRVINDGNPKLGTEEVNCVDDKVFLLSKSESINPAYGFNPDKSKTDPTRGAKGTDFARKNGLWVSDKGLSLGNSIWWLQTPGDDKRQGWSVYDEGNVNIGYYNEYGVSNKCIGVRPAIWIDL